MPTTWSPQQEAIFAEFEHGTQHAIVRARAGTGKTTTILAAIARAPEQSIVLCAFNKSIETELSNRLTNPRAIAKTAHALGFAEVRRNWNKVRVDQDRGWRIAQQAWAEVTERRVDAAPDPVIAVVKKLVAFAKSMAPFATADDLIE